MDYKKLELDKLGFKSLHKIYRNLSIERIVEEGLLNGETKMAMNGATMVDTGEYTGRSPKDKYFVVESTSKDKLWWGPVNAKVDLSIFDELYDKIIDSYNQNGNTKTYIFDGFAGADHDYALPIRVIAKKAWQNHFCHNMFIRPNSNELENFKPKFTIINASHFQNVDYKKHGLNSKTFIIFNLAKNIAIIGGTEYGGEMKKGIFSILHYMLPQKDILSMHCSANTDNENKNIDLWAYKSNMWSVSEPLEDADIKNHEFKFIDLMCSEIKIENFIKKELYDYLLEKGTVDSKFLKFKNSKIPTLGDEILVISQDDLHPNELGHKLWTDEVLIPQIQEKINEY